MSPFFNGSGGYSWIVSYHFVDVVIEAAAERTGGLEGERTGIEGAIRELGGLEERMEETGGLEGERTGIKGAIRELGGWEETMEETGGWAGE